MGLICILTAVWFVYLIEMLYLKMYFNCFHCLCSDDSKLQTSKTQVFILTLLTIDLCKFVSRLSIFCAPVI